MVEMKVNYYDSSLYPSKSPEVTSDALCINLPLNKDISDQGIVTFVYHN